MGTFKLQNNWTLIETLIKGIHDNIYMYKKQQKAKCCTGKMSDTHQQALGAPEALGWKPLVSRGTCWRRRGLSDDLG